MKKITLILFCVTASLLSYAQTEKDDFIIMSQLKEKELYSIQSKGWTLLKYDAGETSLANLSNKDYILYLSLTCKNQTIRPSYLIEHNNNYGDGDWAGVDFASSQAEDGKVVQWAIDQKGIDNPFEKKTTRDFEKFKAALKRGKNLSLKFYTEEYNPNTAKDEPRLNREIIFNLENSHLLDVATDCDEEDTTEVPTTGLVDAAE